MTRFTLALLTFPLSAQLLVDTVAGGKIRTGIPDNDAALTQITGLAYDTSGALVFCDRAENLIRRVRPDGILETIAGNGITGSAGDNGPALNASFNTPGYPRFDPAGNLYLADVYNYRIRRIDTHGVITTIAGDGIPYRSGMDTEGPALQRSIGYVTDLAADSRGNIYFIDDYVRLRRVTSAGRIESLSGVTSPTALAIDADNLYVADGGSSNAAGITRYSPDGKSTPFAGYGQPTGTNTNDDGQPANGLYIYRITGLAAAAGNVYLTQEPLPIPRSTLGTRIRSIDSSGIIHTVAGGQTGALSPDGLALPSTIGPYGLAASPDGTLAFAETPDYPAPMIFASRIRTITPQSALKTIAGGTPQPAPDGTPAREAWLLSPSAIAFNRAGDLFIAESASCLIRRVGADSRLTTVAGTGKCGTAFAAQPATGPDLPQPGSLAIDSNGRIFMLDNGGNSYVITPDGKFTPTGYPPTIGQGHIAIDSKDRIYLFSLFQGLRFTPDGKMETIVKPPSQPGVPPSGFGPTSMTALGTGADGGVYFTGDYLGSPTNYIFRVNDDGTFTQVHGSAAAQLFLLSAHSLAVDSSGTVWLAGGTLSTVTSRGQLTVGIQEGGYSGDGGPAQSARFNTVAVALAPNGDLYVLDADRVRKLTGLARAKTPTISSGGIVNAFSYAAGPIAPGELVTIFGTNFAADPLQVATTENNRLPFSLGRTKVFFNGYAGAITAVTPTQINVFVPNWLQPDRTTTVIVQVDDAASTPVEIPIAKAAPGLFSTVIRNGNILTLYGTGEGLTNPQPLWGDLTISTPYPTPVENVTATIDGQPAQILYAGAAPFLPAGIFQLNIQAPASPKTLTLTIGGISTSINVAHALVRRTRACRVGTRADASSLTFPQTRRHIDSLYERNMPPPTTLLQGTLDVLILKVLSLDAMHGLGISRRIAQITGGTFDVKPGSLFPALHRMEQAGWLSAEWGESQSNRRAKFYRLTTAGRRQLKEETTQWTRIAAAMASALGTP